MVDKLLIKQGTLAERVREVIPVLLALTLCSVYLRACWGFPWNGLFFPPARRVSAGIPKVRLEHAFGLLALPPGFGRVVVCRPRQSAAKQCGRDADHRQHQGHLERRGRHYYLKAITRAVVIKCQRGRRRW